MTTIVPLLLALACTQTYGTGYCPAGQCISAIPRNGPITCVACSGGGGSPAGTNTMVQFNDGGAFGGDAGFTYNKTTKTITNGATTGVEGLTFTNAGARLNLQAGTNRYLYSSAFGLETPSAFRVGLLRSSAASGAAAIRIEAFRLIGFYDDPVGTTIASISGMGASGQDLTLTNNATYSGDIILDINPLTSGNILLKGAVIVSPTKTLTAAGGLTGPLTGNASTATAFATNPSDCAAGQAARGIDANGTAWGCWTPAGGSLPIATQSVLGGVMIGTTMQVAGDGTIDYTGQDANRLHPWSVADQDSCAVGFSTNDVVINSAGELCRCSAGLWYCPATTVSYSESAALALDSLQSANLYRSGVPSGACSPSRAVTFSDQGDLHFCNSGTWSGPAAWGNVLMANHLNTSAATTNFWRGDNTWAVPTSSYTLPPIGTTTLGGVKGDSGGALVCGGISVALGFNSAGTLQCGTAPLATKASELENNPSDCPAGTRATAIAANGNLTCAAIGLADFTANQGTVYTVLHGNAAGQPSFGAVSLATDVSGTLPMSSGGLGTNALGACAAGQHLNSNGSSVTCTSHSIQVSDLGFSGTPSSTTYARGDGTWATPSGSGGSPGGTNTMVQFNDNGSFGGSSGLTYSKDTNTLSSGLGVIKIGSPFNFGSVYSDGYMYVSSGNVISSATVSGSEVSGTVGYAYRVEPVGVAPGNSCSSSGLLAAHSGGPLTCYGGTWSITPRSNYANYADLLSTGGKWVSAPATATTTCVQGDFSGDASYLYICYATNTWRRVATSTW
jgi:hypothetical protein